MKCGAEPRSTKRWNATRFSKTAAFVCVELARCVELDRDAHAEGRGHRRHGHGRARFIGLLVGYPWFDDFVLP